jgi:hypothetical protein
MRFMGFALLVSLMLVSSRTSNVPKDRKGAISRSPYARFTTVCVPLWAARRPFPAWFTER